MQGREVVRVNGCSDDDADLKNQARRAIDAWAADIQIEVSEIFCAIFDRQPQAGDRPIEAISTHADQLTPLQAARLLDVLAYWRNVSPHPD